MYRSLSVQWEDDDEQWLSNNIFHEQCTLKGEACDIINVDGGNFRNVT